MSVDFPAGSVYQAQVIKQVFSITKDETPCIALICKLQGRLVNPRRPGAGLLPCQAVEADCMLRFPANNDQVMMITYDNLTRLGFDSENIDLLNPQEPGHHSFVGKTVHVAPKEQISNDTVVTYWNLRFPKDYEAKPVASGAFNRSPAAARFRDLLKGKKAEAAGLATAAGAASGSAAPSTQTADEEIPY